MNDQAIGIVDEPNRGDQPDKLDIGRHATALSEFIQRADTPITIGIQGEWGSGKTSLLNSIWNKLDQSNEYKQIWINSWEYSLLSTPEEALLKIINRIIDELLESDQNVSRSEAIKGGAEDCSSEGLDHEIITKKDSFYKVKVEIEKKISEFVSLGIEWLPINKILLDKEKTKSVLTFLDTLENDDDVQHVYANLEIDNNFEKKIST